MVENKVLGFGRHVWEKRRVKIVFFTLRMYFNLQILLSGPSGHSAHFLSVGNGLSTALGRSVKFPSVGIALSAPFSLRGRIKVIIFKIATI